jgi:hypothetical protein
MFCFSNDMITHKRKEKKRLGYNVIRPFVFEGRHDLEFVVIK